MTADVQDYEKIVNESKQGYNYFTVIKDDLSYELFSISENDNNIEVGLEKTVICELDYRLCKLKNKAIILDAGSFNKNYKSV